MNRKRQITIALVVVLVLLLFSMQAAYALYYSNAYRFWWLGTWSATSTMSNSWQESGGNYILYQTTQSIKAWPGPAWDGIVNWYTCIYNRDGAILQEKWYFTPVPPGITKYFVSPPYSSITTPKGSPTQDATSMEHFYRGRAQVNPYLFGTHLFMYYPRRYDAWTNF